MLHPGTVWTMLITLFLELNSDLPRPLMPGDPTRYLLLWVGETVLRKGTGDIRKVISQDLPNGFTAGFD